MAPPAFPGGCAILLPGDSIDNLGSTVPHPPTIPSPGTTNTSVERCKKRKRSEIINAAEDGAKDELARKTDEGRLELSTGSGINATTFAETLTPDSMAASTTHQAERSGNEWWWKDVRATEAEILRLAGADKLTEKLKRRRGEDSLKLRRNKAVIEALKKGNAAQQKLQTLREKMQAFRETFCVALFNPERVSQNNQGPLYASRSTQLVHDALEQSDGDSTLGFNLRL